MDDFNFNNKSCGLYGGLPKNDFPIIDRFENKTCGLYGGLPKTELPKIELFETKTCGLYGGLPKNEMPDLSGWQTKINIQPINPLPPLQNQINLSTGRMYQTEMMQQRPMLQNEIKLI